MEPSSPPPWRVLETPGPVEPARPTAAPAHVAAGRSVAVKVAAGLAGAVACTGLAIVVALSGGDGDVRLDGGSPLALADASGDPGASALAVGGEVVVEIVGAVQAPGVYRMAPGSRLADLLERAGGYGPRVDTERAEQELNLAAPVKDGQHIRVPSRDDRVSSPVAIASADQGSSDSGALVDINSATQAQLVFLLDCVAGGIAHAREVRDRQSQRLSGRP